MTAGLRAAQIPHIFENYKHKQVLGPAEVAALGWETGNFRICAAFGNNITHAGRPWSLVLVPGCVSEGKGRERDVPACPPLHSALVYTGHPGPIARRLEALELRVLDRSARRRCGANFPARNGLVSDVGTANRNGLRDQHHGDIALAGDCAAGLGSTLDGDISA
jgi:hypothetical protein